MSASDSGNLPIHNRRFATTHWSLVRAAGQLEEPETPESRNALETLCRLYWFPLYAHIRRKCGDTEKARDLTQEFFSRLIEKDYLKTADRERGRFRTFLLSAIDHFLANEFDREQAQKRGGDRNILSIDVQDAEHRYSLETTDHSTPETAFEKSWAVALLDGTFDELCREHQSPDKQELFNELRDYLPKECHLPAYSVLATRLKMSESAVKVAIHRLRKRFGTLLRQRVLQTVDSPQEVDDEIRKLFEALSR